MRIKSLLAKYYFVGKLLIFIQIPKILKYNVYTSRGLLDAAIESWNQQADNLVPKKTLQEKNN